MSAPHSNTRHPNIFPGLNGKTGSARSFPSTGTRLTRMATFAVPAAPPVFARTGPRATRVWQATRPQRYWLPIFICLALLAFLCLVVRAVVVGQAATSRAVGNRGASVPRADRGNLPLPVSSALVPSEFLAQNLATDANHFVLISKDQRQLTVYEKMRSFPVAVGRNAGNKQRVGDCRTPETAPGHVFPVQRKLVTAPDSPFGARFLGLATPWQGIAIHGTNDPASVGTMASHGCVRLHNPDAMWLYDTLQIGDPVVITR